MTGALFSVRASRDHPANFGRISGLPTRDSDFSGISEKWRFLPEHQDRADSRSDHVELFGLLESRPFGMAKHSERAPWVQEAVLCVFRLRASQHCGSSAASPA
jgi:hypothetical protein